MTKEEQVQKALGLLTNDEKKRWIAFAVLEVWASGNWRGIFEGLDEDGAPTYATLEALFKQYEDQIHSFSNRIEDMISNEIIL